MPRIKQAVTAYDCYEEFKKDLTCTKRETWLREVNLARKFMDDTIQPQDIGIKKDNKPWTNYNPVRKIVHQIFAKGFSNPLSIEIGPYEGNANEEDVSKICDCVLKFEASAKRGTSKLNLVREIENAGMEGLITGMLYNDSRIDESLSDEIFENGLPAYWSPIPEDVVLDRAAGRIEDTERRHIIHSMLPKDIETYFDVDITKFSRKDDRDDEYDEERFVEKWDVIETQYRAKEREKMYTLSQDQQIEIALIRSTGRFWESEIKDQVKFLKESYPDQFRYFNVDDFLRYTPKKSLVRTSVYCWYHIAGQKLHNDAYYLGDDFALGAGRFFPISRSPYGWPLPYYLKNPAMLLMLAKTQEMRLVQTVDRQRTWMLGEPTDSFKKKYEKNELGGLIAIGPEDVKDWDEITSLSDVIHFEDPARNFMILSALSQSLENDLSSQFNRFSEQSGHLSRSGVPDKLMSRLMQASDDILTIFYKELNWFVPNQFQRSLYLSLAVLPVNALMMIAGENDKGRAELIQTGKFRERVSVMNVMASLDLTSPEERAMKMQLIARLLEKGQFPRQYGFEFLQFKEPAKMAQEMDEFEMKRNQALSLGTTILEDPLLAQQIPPIIQKYEQEKATIEANK